MENSIEKPENYKVVFGDMAYDGKTNQIECPPTTVKNKINLPKYKVPMQEGEVVIKVENSRAEYEKDENGKIIRMISLDREVPKMPEITGDFEGEINEKGEIVRDTADIDR